MEKPPDADPDSLRRSEDKRQEALDRIDRARQAQMEGNLDRAQTEVTNAWCALDEALALCPGNHRARFLLVSCAMNADDYVRAKSEAMRIYNSLSQEQLEQMGDSVLHLSIAHASKMMGNSADASRFAAEATKLYPDDPQPYMVLGEMCAACGQNQEAEQRCRQALLHNDSPACRHPLNKQNVFFTLCCLGSALVKQKRYSEAEMFLVRAVQTDATSPLALRHLVDVYHGQRRLEEAIAVAEKIRSMDPADEDMEGRIETLRAELAGQQLSARGAPHSARAPQGDRAEATQLGLPQSSKTGEDSRGSKNANPSNGLVKPDAAVLGNQGPSTAHVRVQRGDSLDTAGAPPVRPRKGGDQDCAEWWAICCLDREER